LLSPGITIIFNLARPSPVYPARRVRPIEAWGFVEVMQAPGISYAHSSARRSGLPVAIHLSPIVQPQIQLASKEHPVVELPQHISTLSTHICVAWHVHDFWCSPQA
jgi:hypothetical protein